MYIVITGINTLSRRLVNRLEERHDVVVIEEDSDRSERLYSSTSATVINASPSSIDALQDAGIDKADILISTLKDDNENMVVCSLAKKFGVNKVVSRMEDDQYFEAFEVIGAETVGNTDLLLSEFLSAVEHPYLLKLSNLSNGREILKASIEEDSSLVESTIDRTEKQDSFPKGFSITSVLKPDETVDAEEDPILEAGDELILIGPGDQKEELDEFFENQ